MTTLTVRVPVADMRSEPQHRSERVAQALYGHTVAVSEQRGEFVLAQTDDSYSGWIHAAYLVDASISEANLAVVTSQIALFSEQQGTFRLCLPYGALLRSAGGEKFLAVDNSEIELVFGRMSLNEPVAPAEALKEASALVSVPYLWGGSSSFGYDCSGLVQVIYRRCGIVLPRDSKDQAKCGVEVGREETRAGDLICFPGHIAVAFAAGRILHSSRLRAGVQIESLLPGEIGYREDLAQSITTIRRIIP